MPDQVISLNVGGTLYTTTIGTLTRYPESMLGAMFNGQYLPTNLDKQGSYFIDRDGPTFKYILQYMRSGELCLPNDFQELDILQAEVDYYQIQGLIEKVQELVQKKNQSGHYMEVTEFEETGNFCRFYENPPAGGLHQHFLRSGLVISGPRALLVNLPLPDPAASTVSANTNSYCIVKVTVEPKPVNMSLMHYLHQVGGKLLSNQICNTTDCDGSYTIHKYIWFVPPCE